MMKVADEFAPWLGVFETVRVLRGVPLFLASHRMEFERAMEALGLAQPFDPGKALHDLAGRSGRWRWIATAREIRMLFAEEPAAAGESIALSLSPVRVGSCNWDARFKTLSYLSHAQAWKTGETPEVILLNEQGHVASASRGNIFWRKGARIFTPAHEAGCRCGVVRGFVLNEGEVEIGHYPFAALLDAEEIFITNSMKGIASVNAIEGRSLAAFAAAEKLREDYDQAIAAQLAPGLSLRR